MLRAHTIRLNPTHEQEVYFRKAAGTARFVFNWALARWMDYRAARQQISMNDLKTEFNRIKGERFPWIYDVTKCVAEREFSNLGRALANYFRMKGTGMLANPHLAQAVSDASLAEIARQMTYKANWYGGMVQLVDSFYPSSKMCNACGAIKADLTLSERQWTCTTCGARLERDLNAARNIRDEALRLVTASR